MADKFGDPDLDDPQLDGMPNFVVYNPPYWPRNKKYIIAELALLSLIALGSIFVAFKAFTNKSRQQKLRRARAVFKGTLIIWLISLIAAIASAAAQIIFVERLPDASVDALHAHRETQAIESLFYTFTKACIIGLLVDIAVTTKRAADFRTRFGAVALVAAYTVVGILACYLISLYAVGEVLVNVSGLSFRKQIDLSRKTSDMWAAFDFIVFGASVLIIGLALMVKTTAGAMFHKVTTMLVLAGVFNFVGAAYSFSMRVAIYVYPREFDPPVWFFPTLGILFGRLPWLLVLAVVSFIVCDRRTSWPIETDKIHGEEGSS